MTKSKKYFNTPVQVKLSSEQFKAIKFQAEQIYGSATKWQQYARDILAAALSGATRNLETINTKFTFAAPAYTRMSNRKNNSTEMLGKKSKLRRTAYAVLTLDAVLQQQLFVESELRQMSRPLLVASILEREIANKKLLQAVPANYKSKKTKVNNTVVYKVSLTPEELSKIPGLTSAAKSLRAAQKVKASLKKLTKAALQKATNARKDAYQIKAPVSIINQSLVKQIETMAKKFKTKPALLIKACLV